MAKPKGEGGPAKPSRCSGSPSINGCRRQPKDHQRPYCMFCGRPMEHHRPGEVDVERDGRRRMAEARRAAGSPLDAIDQKVLQGS